MRRYENRSRLLAIGLAALAGFVDALGFLKLGGMFVSFMSGNSTRMAAGVATPIHGSLFAGALIAAFVVGVMTGTVGGQAAGRWRQPAVLAIVLCLLVAGCLAETLVGRSTPATLLVAGAMGAANAIFQRDGEVSVGVTYMTGTLVKFAQHLTAALTGGPRLGWMPYFLLWLGLMAGATAGASAYRLIGFQALWMAVGFGLCLLLQALWLGPLPARE
ncbi:MAG: DUF1275 domain-containing protein [Sphingobium sp.]|uniref:YoaK family protein n=1 Tax=Sphingobium sp. TaxID=1912891 RepID=UPI000DB2D328|nr:YoaK family protein [Sphingobium sp.]PZU14815.1 MAG: DUF1275 domain-containing protein [Sphingobium sp.]